MVPVRGKTSNQNPQVVLVGGNLPIKNVVMKSKMVHPERFERPTP
jgi:hypothetical protein